MAVECIKILYLGLWGFVFLSMKWAALWAALSAGGRFVFSFSPPLSWMEEVTSVCIMKQWENSPGCLEVDFFLSVLTVWWVCNWQCRKLPENVYGVCKIHMQKREKGIWQKRQVKLLEGHGCELQSSLLILWTTFLHWNQNRGGVIMNHQAAVLKTRSDHYRSIKVCWVQP